MPVEHKLIGILAEWMNSALVKQRLKKHILYVDIIIYRGLGFFLTNNLIMYLDGGNLYG